MVHDYFFSNQSDVQKIKTLYRQSLENQNATKASRVMDKWSHLVQVLEDLHSMSQDILPKELEFT